MKLEIKEITSPDIDDRDRFVRDFDLFSVPVQVKIGFADGSSQGDIFSFLVCSPEWLRVQVEGKGSRWGLHLFIMSLFDLRVVEEKLQRVIASVDVEQWGDAVTTISKYMDWEYSNYRK